MHKEWLTLRGKGIAFVAACLLVLQSLTGALALGYASVSPMLDAFGNPICITLSEIADNSSDQNDQPMIPDCCTINCSMFATIFQDQPASHSLENPLLQRTDRLMVAEDYLLSGSLISDKPGSPRSPPFI